MPLWVSMPSTPEALLPFAECSPKALPLCCVDLSLALSASGLFLGKTLLIVCPQRVRSTTKRMLHGVADFVTVVVLEEEPTDFFAQA